MVTIWMNLNSSLNRLLGLHFVLFDIFFLIFLIQSNCIKKSSAIDVFNVLKLSSCDQFWCFLWKSTSFIVSHNQLSVIVRNVFWMDFSEALTCCWKKLSTFSMNVIVCRIENIQKPNIEFIKNFSLWTSADFPFFAIEYSKQINY